MTKHEPLDQTNPENRCTVDGVEYVACKRTHGCDGCAGNIADGLELCGKLGYCLGWEPSVPPFMWRPASEFTPPVATLPAWRPIEEIVNKEDGRRVLLLNGALPVVGYWDDPWWADARECMTLHSVTHFIEIPKNH